MERNSLHDELGLMVKAGLSPMAALQAATLNPARFLGLEESLGTVEKGKLADLVSLEANPLADINNTKRISAVVANGRLFDRTALTTMLNEVETTVREEHARRECDPEASPLRSIFGFAGERPEHILNHQD